MTRMNRILRIAGINIAILLALLIPIELWWGGWLNPQQINHLNLLRNQHLQVRVGDYYQHPTGQIMYTRDQYGLRGSAFNAPERIDVLTMGGSTTDQRYIDDKATWQSLLEQRFANAGNALVFANAGVDGHSTFGHLKSFELWLPQIPNLHPRYILFYVGINDFNIGANHERDRIEASTLAHKSVVYHALKRVYWSFKARQFSLTHHKINLQQTAYVNQPLVKNPTDYASLTLSRRQAYAQRLQQLIQKTRNQHAIPILVSQPTAFYYTDTAGVVYGISSTIPYDVPINGVDYFYLQQQMDATCKLVAQQQQVLYIDAARLTHWSRDDFYDYVHLNPTGTQKLADVLYGKLQGVMKGR